MVWAVLAMGGVTLGILGGLSWSFARTSIKQSNNLIKMAYEVASLNSDVAKLTTKVDDLINWAAGRNVQRAILTQRVNRLEILWRLDNPNVDEVQLERVLRAEEQRLRANREIRERGIKRNGEL